MSYDDDGDDTVLYPDRVYAERPTRLVRSSGVPTMPNEATFRAFLDGPDIEAVSAPAFAILQRKRSLLARSFRSIGRSEAVKDAAAAAETMRYIRQFLAEYEGAQHDAALHVQSVIGIAQQTDRAVRLHDLRTELDLQGLRESNAAAEANRKRRRVAEARAETLIDGGARAAFGPANTVGEADPWDAQDDISRRARIAAITGAASADAEKIDDPAVAFAALCFVKKLHAGADEDTARRAAFSDVRDLIAANRLGPKDAETYSQALKQARTEFKKSRDSKAGLASWPRPSRGGKHELSHDDPEPTRLARLHHDRRRSRRAGRPRDHRLGRAGDPHRHPRIELLPMLEGRMPRVPGRVPRAGLEREHERVQIDQPRHEQDHHLAPNHYRERRRRRVQMSDDPVDSNDVFNPTRVLIGYDPRTGEPVYLPRSSYIGRSAELIGPCGLGKATYFWEGLRALTESRSGDVVYDLDNRGVFCDAYLALRRGATATNDEGETK